MVNFIEPLFNEALLRNEQPVIVDHGAGKSYLGFILYDLLLKQHTAGQVIGIESRPELVAQSQQLAAELQFARMDFQHLTVAESITSPNLPAKVDMVTALHA